MENVNNANEFRLLVSGLENRFNCDFNFENRDESQDLRIVEDDGNLHVSRFGVRVWFDIGQELSRSEFNRRARRIMNLLGIPQELQADGLL